MSVWEDGERRGQMAVAVKRRGGAGVGGTGTVGDADPCGMDFVGYAARRGRRGLRDVVLRERGPSGTPVPTREVYHKKIM